jgi:hypothetical protein
MARILSGQVSLGLGFREPRGWRIRRTGRARPYRGDLRRGVPGRPCVTALVRYLMADDELEGAPPVIGIGQDEWQQLFGGDPLGARTDAFVFVRQVSKGPRVSLDAHRRAALVEMQDHREQLSGLRRGQLRFARGTRRRD